MDVEYNGEVLKAGTYEFAVDGCYWADFDRQHPIEGPARAQAWTARRLCRRPAVTRTPPGRFTGGGNVGRVGLNVRPTALTQNG